MIRQADGFARRRRICGHRECLLAILGVARCGRPYLHLQLQGFKQNFGIPQRPHRPCLARGSEGERSAQEPAPVLPARPSGARHGNTRRDECHRQCQTAEKAGRVALFRSALASSANAGTARRRRLRGRHRTGKLRPQRNGAAFRHEPYSWQRLSAPGSITHSHCPCQQSFGSREVRCIRSPGIRAKREFDARTRTATATAGKHRQGQHGECPSQED